MTLFESIKKKKQVIHHIDAAISILVSVAIWKTFHAMVIPPIVGVASYCLILRFVFVWRYWVCANCRKNLGLLLQGEKFCKHCGTEVRKG